jgi:hypothetical protein
MMRRDAQDKEEPPTAQVARDIRVQVAIQPAPALGVCVAQGAPAAPDAVPARRHIEIDHEHIFMLWCARSHESGRSLTVMRDSGWTCAARTLVFLGVWGPRWRSSYRQRPWAPEEEADICQCDASRPASRLALPGCSLPVLCRLNAQLASQCNRPPDPDPSIHDFSFSCTELCD